jgi:hypothetical protein
LILTETVVMDAIAADTNYTILEGTRVPYSKVATRTINPDLGRVPTQPEFVAWRRRILDMLNAATGRNIWNAGQFNAAVGNQPDGRTWWVLNWDLTLWLASAPQAEPVADYVVSAANLPGSYVGYQQGASGSINNDEWHALTITRVANNTTNDSLEFSFQLVAPLLEQDVFTSITVDGTVLMSEDAVYTQSSQTWVWADTGLDFNNNQDYDVAITY